MKVSSPIILFNPYLVGKSQHEALAEYIKRDNISRSQPIEVDMLPLQMNSELNQKYCEWLRSLKGGKQGKDSNPCQMMNQHSIRLDAKGRPNQKWSQF